MTTLAYKDGTIASDSRSTMDDYAIGKCVKLYRVKSKVDPIKGDVIVGTAGHGSSSLLFVDWLEQGGDPSLHERGVDEHAEFECLVLHKSGLYMADRLCRLEKIEDEVWAAGSGRHAALGAMYAGKSAVEAVRIAARIDPFTGGRVVSMSLRDEVRTPKRDKKRSN